MMVWGLCKPFPNLRKWRFWGREKVQAGSYFPEPVHTALNLTCFPQTGSQKSLFSSVFLLQKLSTVPLGGLQKGVSKAFNHSGLFSDEYVLFLFSAESVFIMLIFILHPFPFFSLFWLFVPLWGSLPLASRVHRQLLTFVFWVSLFVIECGSTRGEDDSGRYCLVGGAWR